MKTETFVDMYYPRSFCDEFESKKVEGRDIEKCIEEMPKHCHFFQFRDVVIQTATREDGSTFEDTQTVNESPRYYPGGELLTLEKVKQLTPEKDWRILVSNMECNGWDSVIKTCRGAIHNLYSKGSIIVSLSPVEGIPCPR